MGDFNYDTYCGLYCGACSILKAYQSGVADPFACMFRDELGLELQCHGCKSDRVFGNCAKCTIRPCAAEKGVEHCYECPSYPCQIYASMHLVLDKLPHWSTAASNVDMIKMQGVQKWLEAQEAQWKCPDCQSDYSWYATHCTQCGKDLGDLKPYRNSFDKSIFQMMEMPDPDEMFRKEVLFKLPDMDQVKIQRDIVYSAVQGNELHLDLYLPPDPAADQMLPLVVLVHGEAQVPNLKDSGEYQSLGRIIAASGMAAAAFNHRVMLQGAGINDVIADIERLIAFLSGHAAGYGLDKNRIAIWCLSAGVPFGLYAGMHNSPEPVKCMVAYYGFGDFTSLIQLFQGAISAEGLEQQAQEYAPLKLIREKADQISPLLVARAGMDQIPMLLDSLDGFISAALQNNVPIDVYNHATGVHAFDLLNDHPRTYEIIEKTLAFLKKHLSAV